MKKGILYVFFLAGAASFSMGQGEEREVTYVDGVIPRVLTAPDPAQMISPFAPPEYGSAWSLVTFTERDPLRTNNPHPPKIRPDGIRLISIRPFW